MPIYEYRCNKCEAVFEEQHKIDERDLPLQNPCAACGGELYIGLGALGFVDPIRIGIRKPPGWFNDKLKEIKKKHPKGNVNIIE